ncbi:MAG: hypothetical protein QXK95_03715 [Nitrososphaerota archaeon]
MGAVIYSITAPPPAPTPTILTTTIVTTVSTPAPTPILTTQVVVTTVTAPVTIVTTPATPELIKLTIVFAGSVNLRFLA